MKSAHEDLDEIRGEPSGTLAVGAGNTIGMYLLPQILGEFRRANSLVRISLRIGTVNELLQALARKEIDVALVEQEVPAVRQKDLNQTAYGEDELVLIVPPDHPWASAVSITPSDILKTPLLVRHPDSRTRQLIFKHLGEAGVDTASLDIFLEVGNTEALKRMVMAGLGVAFVSRFAIEHEVSNRALKVVPIEGISIKRKLWLLTPPSESLPERLKRFSAFITGHPPKLSALFTAMALALGGTPPEILPSEQGNAATGPDRHERIHEKWRKTV